MAAKTDDQNVLNLDVSKLFETYITPIDQHRVKKAGKYIESRCHAYYRIIGFPVVDKDGNLYSPGYNPNANLTPTILKTHESIDNGISNDVISQLGGREIIFKNYQNIFDNGDFNAVAITLGSMFVRRFDQQFTDDLEPLENDPKQVQAISDRVSYLKALYNNNQDQITAFTTLSSSGKLLSNHPLKPFCVNPFLVLNDLTKSVAAPFLSDASQLNVFPAMGNSGILKRPFIEEVISTRFQNTDYFQSQDLSSKVADIVSNIKDNPDILDDDLVKLSANPGQTLQNSDIAIFNSYFRIIRAIIDQLVGAIQDVKTATTTVNFQPIPDKLGIENGGTVNPVDPNDPNNIKHTGNGGNANSGIELDISQLMAQRDVNQLSFIISTGLNSKPDPGGYVFGLGANLFTSNKSEEASFDDRIKALNDRRNRLIENGISNLQTIEMIMGEFSGLGLIDIYAIQMALFSMPPEDLVGLIDQEAFTRASTTKIRPDLSFTGRTADGLAALKSFQTILQNIYLLIQAYYDQSFDGTKFNAQ